MKILWQKKLFIIYLNWKKSSFSYDSDKEIYRDSLINIKLLLLNASKVNFNGDIIIQVENDKIIDANYDGLISNKLKRYINEVINFDYEKVKNYIEDKFFSRGLRNGTLSINFNWKNSSSAL